MNILDSIIGGYYDEALDEITDAIRDRRKLVARRTTAALRPGDTVRFSSLIRPKYLAGMEATVVKVNRESVVVNCPDDTDYGRFRNSRNVRCPNSLIEGAA